MNRYAPIALFLLWGLIGVVMMPPAAHAVAVDAGRLQDPALEAQAQQVMKELRCLVCQNQAINESNAPLAADLRQVVRERVVAGDDEAAIKRFMVERYGDWVLLKPPFKAETFLLWWGPALLALLGLGLLVMFYRRRSAQPEATALSAEEAARLEKILSARTDQEGQS